MKRCTSCGQVKPETEFWRDVKGDQTGGQTRRRARCRECCKKAVRDRSGGEKPASKICTYCKVHKPLDAFHKHRICLYGVESICKECKFRKRRARNALYPERLRNVELKAKYGITLEDYEAMHARQGGRCAICGAAEAKLVVDHEHVTRRVRSLLCHLCNAMIGCAREDAAILAAGIGYLRRHAEEVSADLLGGVSR